VSRRSLQAVSVAFTADRKGGTSVPKQPDKADDLSRAGTIQRLVKETGITEAEASNLLTLLGSDWSSLVREARLLKPKH
jgi:hypothetical protein